VSKSLRYKARYKNRVSVNKLKNKLLHLILKKWLQILNLIVNRKLSSIDINYVTYLLNSGLIPSSNEKFFDWDKTWKKAMLEWNAGQYQKSVTTRIELMQEIYLANKINFKDYYPPFLSRIFAGPIGHNGIIGVHIGAQKFGLIPKGKRSLPVSNLMASRPFFLSTKDYINLITFQNQSSGDELPSQWHVYERHQLIKTEDGFVDLYPLIENVFSYIEDLTETPILTLDYKYEKIAKFELNKLGVGDDDWFVTLHVRDTGLEGETREQPIESYLKSIHHILNQGGKIIRIGDESMNKLPSIPGVIDLTKNFAMYSKLHLYALARAKFFIGTNSGPKFMPPLYGVPSLITNLTSIGLESLALTSKTIYIPKAIIRNNQPVSLSDTLNSHMGFNNFTARELNHRNINLKCNTENDILNGVKEMIGIVFNNYNDRELSLDSKVKEIREKVHFSSKGNFSTSWLRQNESWFLNSN